MSALVGVLAATSHAGAYEDAGQPYLCDVKSRTVFRKPLTLDTMKKVVLVLAGLLILGLLVPGRGGIVIAIAHSGSRAEL